MKWLGMIKRLKVEGEVEGGESSEIELRAWKWREGLKRKV